MFVIVSDSDSRVSGVRKGDVVWVAGQGKRHFECRCWTSNFPVDLQEVGSNYLVGQ